MKRPILPEKVHIIVQSDYDYEDNILVIHNEYRFCIPYKWLVFNGQGKYRQWSWNKNYMKQINGTIGQVKDGDIYVIEWNIVEYKWIKDERTQSDQILIRVKPSK